MLSLSLPPIPGEENIYFGARFLMVFIYPGKAGTVTKLGWKEHVTDWSYYGGAVNTERNGE